MKATKRKPSNKKTKRRGNPRKLTDKTPPIEAPSPATRQSSRILIRKRLKVEDKADSNILKDNSTSELDREAAGLQDQVLNLESFIDEFVSTHRYMKGTIGSWMESTVYNPQKWTEFMDGCFMGVKNWVFDFALDDPEHLNRLSEDKKKLIIKGLDGYCIQEDFDAIVARLPEVSAIMYLTKHTVNNIFQSPFWCLNGAPESYSTVGEENLLHFREHVNTLYKQFLETHPTVARIWRCLTIRLSDSVSPDQAPNTVFGNKTREYRNLVLKAMVSDLLEDETLKLLLKPTESRKDRQIRADDLYYIYERNGQQAIDFFAQHPCLEFSTLPEIGARFQYGSDRVEARKKSLPDMRAKRLDGNRILGILQPLICRRGGFEDADVEVVVSKAYALVEEESS